MEKNKKILKNLADTYIAIAQNLYDIHLGKESDESKEYRRKAKVIEEFLIKYNELEEENKKLKMLGELQHAHLVAKTQVLKDCIPKSKIKEKIEELKNKIKSNKQELDKNPDPVNSKFYSFDDYFKWKNKILKENEILEHTLKVLQDLLREE